LLGSNHIGKDGRGLGATITGVWDVHRVLIIDKNTKQKKVYKSVRTTGKRAEFSAREYFGQKAF